MQPYETRIIRPEGSVALLSHGSHLNASSAIRAAKKLCREGELAEVWQDDVCVYSECPGHTGALVWPLQDKAANA
jgi:hypothetical protein